MYIYMLMFRIKLINFAHFCSQNIEKYNFVYIKQEINILQRANVFISACKIERPVLKLVKLKDGYFDVQSHNSRLVH